MKIKHSKFKNTGILFELLVRQITADTLKGGDSPAIDLLKTYFVKSELGREYKFLKNYNQMREIKTKIDSFASKTNEGLLASKELIEP